MRNGSVSKAIATVAGKPPRDGKEACFTGYQVIFYIILCLEEAVWAVIMGTA
jgi:hypothetical protein